jgi:hypothetical protein
MTIKHENCGSFSQLATKSSIVDQTLVAIKSVESTGTARVNKRGSTSNESSWEVWLLPLSIRMGSMKLSRWSLWSWLRPRFWPTCTSCSFKFKIRSDKTDCIQRRGNWSHCATSNCFQNTAIKCIPCALYFMGIMTASWLILNLAICQHDT